jgi:hypothetical protein
MNFVKVKSPLGLWKEFNNCAKIDIESSTGKISIVSNNEWFTSLNNIKISIYRSDNSIEDFFTSHAVIINSAIGTIISAVDIWRNDEDTKNELLKRFTNKKDDTNDRTDGEKISGIVNNFDENIKSYLARLSTTFTLDEIAKLSSLKTINEFLNLYLSDEE